MHPPSTSVAESPRLPWHTALVEMVGPEVSGLAAPYPHSISVLIPPCGWSWLKLIEMLAQVQSCRVWDFNMDNSTAIVNCSRDLSYEMFSSLKAMKAGGGACRIGSMPPVCQCTNLNSILMKRDLRHFPFGVMMLLS